MNMSLCNKYHPLSPTARLGVVEEKGAGDLNDDDDNEGDDVIIIIIMYIYHALINALSTHMIHINLNAIFYKHVEHSPTKTIFIKY